MDIYKIINNDEYVRFFLTDTNDIVFLELVSSVIIFFFLSLIFNKS